MAEEEKMNSRITQSLCLKFSEISNVHSLANVTLLPVLTSQPTIPGLLVKHNKRRQFQPNFQANCISSLQ